MRCGKSHSGVNLNKRWIACSRCGKFSILATFGRDQVSAFPEGVLLPTNKLYKLPVKHLDFATSSHYPTIRAGSHTYPVPLFAPATNHDKSLIEGAPSGSIKRLPYIFYSLTRNIMSNHIASRNLRYEDHFNSLSA